MNQVPHELCNSLVVCVNPGSVLGLLICKWCYSLIKNSQRVLNLCPVLWLLSSSCVVHRKPGCSTFQGKKCPARWWWVLTWQGITPRLPQEQHPVEGTKFCGFLFLPKTVYSTELPRKQSLCLVKNKLLSAKVVWLFTGQESRVEKRSEIVHISFVLELSRHIHYPLPEASGQGLWDLWLVPHCHWGTNWVIIWALQPYQAIQSCWAALPALILMSELLLAQSTHDRWQPKHLYSFEFHVLSSVCPLPSTALYFTPALSCHK